MILIETDVIIDYVILKNGVKLQGGVVKSWSSTGCLLINSSNGQVTKISSADDVVAIVYVSKDKDKNDPVKAKINDDGCIEHKPGDIKSLAALRKMEAEIDMERVKHKLRHLSNKQGPVEYANQLSILRKFKNDPPSET